MTAQPKPLSILIPVLGFSGAGGYRVLARLADHWLQAGCRVAFLAPYWCDPPYYPTQAELLWVDAWGRVQENRPAMTRPPTTIGRMARLIRLYASLWQGLRKLGGHWDILLANHSMTGWPVAMAPVAATKVYYIQAYEPEMYQAQGGLGNSLLQFLSWVSYFLPLHRIANAPLYLDYRACRAEAWVPPGMDLTLFHPPEAAPAGLGLVIGCIGRFQPDKGTEPAIAAYRQFVRSNPGPHRFRIADFGVPPEWLADIPGLERLVPGNDQELAQYYRSLDVLLALCTMQHGAHHYPVLEAMASGLAVITTGYTPATAENAWIVGPDPAEAAQALISILAQPALASERRAKSREAIQDYGWPRVAARFLERLQLARNGQP